MPDWKVEAVTEPDSARLARLTSIVYGPLWKRSGDKPYYDWKLFGGKRPDPIGRVARAGERMAGYVASCHRPFRFGSKIGYASELGDVMTHPDYRRQGMFETLGQAVIQAGEASGYFPIYGFPNPVAYPGWVRKMDMAHVFDVWRMVLPLKPEALLPDVLPNWSGSILGSGLSAGRAGLRRLIGPCRQDLTVDRVTSFGPWADLVWHDALNRSEAGVVKDADYLCWRYDENPDTYRIYRATLNGHPAAWLVTKVRAESRDRVFGFLADFCVPAYQPRIFHALLKLAEADFRADGVCLVDAWITPHRFYLSALAGFGYIPVKRLPFIVPKTQVERLRREGWAHPRHWVLTMADSDNV